MTVRRGTGERTSAQLSGTAVTLLVPVGSTEQHGPHLPLDTDTRIAVAVAGRVAADLGHLPAPAIAYGSSGEHQGFPGTVSIGTEALSTLLLEYGRSACHWAARLVFVNGHGGNTEALRTATGLLRAEGRDAAWCSCSAPAATPTPGTPKPRCCCTSRPGWCARARRAGQHRAAGRAHAQAPGRRGRRGEPIGCAGRSQHRHRGGGETILAAMVSDCAGRIRRWTPDRGGMLT